MFFLCCQYFVFRPVCAFFPQFLTEFVSRLPCTFFERAGFGDKTISPLQACCSPLFVLLSTFPALHSFLGSPVFFTRPFLDFPPGLCVILLFFAHLAISFFLPETFFSPPEAHFLLFLWLLPFLFRFFRLSSFLRTSLS